MIFIMNRITLSVVELSHFLTQWTTHRRNLVSGLGSQMVAAVIFCGLALAQDGSDLSGQDAASSPTEDQMENSDSAEIEIPEPEFQRPKIFSAGFQYLYQPTTDLDSAGDFETHRAGLQLTSRFRLSEKDQVAVSLGYIWNDYNFSSSTSTLAANPWSGVHFMSLGASYRRVINEDWTFFGIPSVRLAGESDADFEDTIMGGGIFGAMYKVNDRLSIGPGFGMMTQLEDDATLFPVVFVTWKFAENWSIGTTGGSGAALGPGLRLSWTPKNKPFSADLNANFEQLRFRLDSNSPQRNGIGQDQSVRIGGAFHWNLNPGFDLSAMAGVKLGGEISIEDSQGNEWRSEDYDPAPYFGLGAKVSF